MLSRPLPVRASFVLLAALGALPSAACSKDRNNSAPKPGASVDAAPSSVPSGSEPAPSAPFASAGKDDEAPANAPDASSVAIAAEETGVVTLTNPGALPRHKLRYKFRVGQREDFFVDIKMAATTELNGAHPPEVALPVLHASMQLEPKAVTPEGDCQYDYQLLSFDVVPDPRVPPELAANLRHELEPFRGLSGSAVITSRGVTKRATFQVPENAQNASPQGAQVLEQMRQTVREMAVVLPEEEVGKGAQWDKTSRAEAKDVKVTQKEHYTLVDLHDDTGKLDIVLSQSAPPQPMKGPMGADVQLEQLASNGKGTSAFDLIHIVPSSQLDATTSMVLAGAQAEATKQRVKMTMKFGVKVERSKN